MAKDGAASDQMRLPFGASLQDALAQIRMIESADLGLSWGRKYGVVDLLQRLLILSKHAGGRRVCLDACVSAIAARVCDRKSVSERTVRNWTRDAEALGLLERRQMGGVRWNRYVLHLDRIPGLLEAARGRSAAEMTSELDCREPPFAGQAMPAEMIRNGRQRAETSGNDFRPERQRLPTRAETVAALCYSESISSVSVSGSGTVAAVGEGSEGDGGRILSPSPALAAVIGSGGGGVLGAAQRADLLREVPLLAGASQRRLDPLPLAPTMFGNAFAPLTDAHLRDLVPIVEWQRRQLSARVPLCGETEADLLLTLAAAIEAAAMPAAMIKRSRVAVFVHRVSRGTWHKVLMYLPAARQWLDGHLERHPDAFSRQPNSGSGP